MINFLAEFCQNNIIGSEIKNTVAIIHCYRPSETSISRV